MNKKILILLLSILFVYPVFALDVVYPKKDSVTINSPKSFFIGSADPSIKLYINGEESEVHSSGGFAKQINLKYGKNVFELKSGEDKLVYTINRPIPSKNSQAANSNKFIAYKSDKYAVVLNSNTPLRSTPVDGGINRMAHLPKDFPLILIGEKNGFYKVYLGGVKDGWIAKSSVKLTNDATDLVEIYGTEFENDGEFFKYTFHLTGKAPWEVKEDNGLIVNLYNIKDYDNNTFTAELPKSQLLASKNLVGYQTYYSDNDFILKVRQPLRPDKKNLLKGIKIVIDAGHGGSELGAIGCLGDNEKDVNLAYAKELEKELISRKADVILTRNTDEYLGLQERVDITNDENAVIFISLHGNALIDSMDPMTNRGTEIYYYYNQAKPLSAFIMYNLLAKTDTINHGIKQESFAVVRNTNALSILIELGYLINPSDNAKLLDNSFRKKTVDAIADGIEDFVRSQINSSK